jgi:alpha-galactosidase
MVCRNAWLVVVVFCCGLIVRGQEPAVAQTPPMGWNSYNCYGSAVHEDEVRANADYMARNLRGSGWQYIVVDFLWAYDNPPGSLIGNPFQKRLQDGAYIPWLAMDAWGRLLPDANKFPSAFGGKGFKLLADYVHGLGLKFGIHVMRGIPRQAVWAKTPVRGAAAGITADMIADTNSTCPWMNHMYGLNMRAAGTQEYLNSLLDLYASWGVDFIKVDDIARPYSAAEIEGYRHAIGQCGRAVVLSLSPGETPFAQAEHVAGHANMWRMADDFWDSWKEMEKMFDYAKRWEGIGGAGHWPDCDMIQIGRISKRGPVGSERWSRLTPDECRTHMSFWCIYRSPLMLGGNLPENREWELEMFNNPEVLGVNQRGEGPRQVYKDTMSMVWVSREAGARVEEEKESGGKTAKPVGRVSKRGGKAMYVALFNIGEEAHDVAVDFAKLGLSGKIAVRDLWKRTDLGVFKKRFAMRLVRHGSALLRVDVGE